MDSLQKHHTDRMEKGRRIWASDRGIALLITLWLLVILTVMAFSFSSLVRTEAYSTFAFKDSIENKYFAEAGIQRGITEIFYRIAARSGKTSPVPSGEAAAAYQVAGSSYTGRIGDGFYRVSITNDGGKININTLSDQTGIILNTLLVNAGLDKEKADGIVDALLDWKDGDSDTRLKGAETDYYLSLPSPYRAKNKNFETLEELLLIKGMTPDLLYGVDNRNGLINHLTVHSSSPQINMDVATRDVLMALPAMTSEICDGIEKARQNNAIDKIRDYQNIIANRHPFIMPYLGVGESGIYTINAIGYKESEKKGYPIVARIIIEGAGAYRFLYYKSPGYLTK